MADAVKIIDPRERVGKETDKMALFEGYERRIDQNQRCVKQYMVSALSKKLKKLQKDAGLDVYDQVKKIQPICFEPCCRLTL